ncbi:UDP-2,3-diacylglucosamine diphosphatase [Iodobacter sp. LRB]|uniref:UDP-2,3-diacylglucosamine diphosphatase n=1 Tax=unclassified Iodobacter TaxID=235634 RepID=UPI000C0C6037|nr:UDP-2,3-diacylglucosamine diphosphatase [Iodobacter sp. BJB302]PHV00431.1 UDP-2,3-diacylglucosamine diphosphatase [Iodobacter sp. BJB302]
MPSPILFISDLHLSPNDPATTAAFHTFLQGPARTASALYILGDLFEFWIGDDSLDEAFNAEIVHAIAQLAGQGVKIFFLAGNRDFLPGTRFASAAKLIILPDPSLITHAGKTLLITHGDALCTDDLAYQRFRRIVRSPIIQALFLALPRSWRQEQVDKLRLRSKASNQMKRSEVMDVNTQAISRIMAQYQVQTLIHGHTHRPAQHSCEQGERWVLPDWYHGKGGYLRWDEKGFKILTLDNQLFQGD